MGSAEDQSQGRDSLQSGHEFAAKAGLLDESAGPAIAYLGFDEQGERQLLIVDSWTLRTADRAGQPTRELQRNEVRSVELDSDEGLRFRGRGWQFKHRVSRHDAEYIRESLIEWPYIPPTGTEGQAIPESDWRHERLARMVGQVVMRAAEAEHALSLVAVHSGDKAPNHEAFGKSGRQLVQALKKCAATSSAIADMCERYDLWSNLRNQLVHSIRPLPSDGTVGEKTFRPKMGSKGPLPENLYDVRTQDLPELVDLYYAFNWLYHDAIRAYRDLATGIKAEDLPRPNSVHAELRLPPQDQ
ncbi:hypothetical protein F7P69_03735 [Cellulosimicrobium funkei]|nr:hypothetical protein [Cellulosimicrobium funkei]